MNIQQLEYIVALEKMKNFGLAAEASFVTQPTLSAMIHKLEEELGVIIFDRRQHPIVPTAEGKQILDHARVILREILDLHLFSQELKSEVSGELRIGIIPTLAPYLLPLFLKSFAEKYPLLKISIKEMVTEEITTKLKSGETDMGLLVTPLKEPLLQEHILFHEEFYAYIAKTEKFSAKKYILPKDINPERLWLLEEGHCFRNQILSLCQLKRKHNTNNLNYEAGSIETLINLVDKYGGVTIIPHFASLHLTGSQKNCVREFADPKPVRQISLVTNATYPRKKLLSQVFVAIKEALPTSAAKRTKRIVEIKK